MSDDTPGTARRILTRIGVGAAAGALATLALAGVGLARAMRFEVSEHRWRIRGLRAPLRLAFLTDLHLGPYIQRSNLRAWARAAVAAEPDLILIGGDFVDRFHRGALTELSAELAGLRAPLGSWGVPGNHDYRAYRDLAPLRRSLQAAGVRLLVNEGAWLRDDVYLAGVDDETEGRPDPRRALADAGDTPGARIVLTHNPDAFPALAAGADLALAGHTHGGQVQVPGVGPVVTSSRYGRRFASGWVDHDPPSFVSRGLGVTMLPIRLNCPAELVLLTLVPAGWDGPWGDGRARGGPA